jgi:hypothetical protein
LIFCSLGSGRYVFDLVMLHFAKRELETLLFVSLITTQFYAFLT